MATEDDLWVTIELAGDYTGMTFEAGDLFAAQGLVELFAGVDFLDTATYNAKLVKKLGQAVAYQAAFMSENPGILQVHSLTSLSQDQTSGTLSTKAAAILAPATIAIIEGLPHKQMGTKLAQRVDRRRSGWDFGLESSDDRHGGWTPL